MIRWKQTIQEHVPLAFVFLCTVILFGRPLLSREALYGGDFALYFYPLKEFIRDHLFKQGTLPLWNPYQFSGTPLIGNIQASLFYPLGFLFYLMPSDQAYAFTVVMHCLLGSVFMYSFMRTASVSKGGSLLSGFVFTFSGFFMGHLYAGHLTFIQNYIWIPLVFRYLYLFVHTQRLPFALAAGLVQGIQILGGFPQISFYTILGGLGFLCFNGVFSLKARYSRDVSRTALGALVVLLAGFGLAALQVAPTLEFSRLSTRGEGLNYAMATYESLDPKELLAFLVPDIFGSAVDQTYWKSRDVWHFWESCGYAGILPLWLAFVRIGEPSLRRLRIFFLLLMGAALVLALGKYNPLYHWIFRLPGFSSFRIPAQILFLYIFGIAALSGIGLDQLQRGSWTWNRGFIPFTVLVGGILALFLLGLHVDPFRFFLNLFRGFSEGRVTHANLDGLYERVGRSIHTAALLFCASSAFLMVSRRIPLGSRAIPLIAFALVAVDLLPFGHQFVKTQALTTAPDKAAILSRLSGTPVQGRVVTMDPGFRTNDGLQHRFASVLGYDPLMLKRYADYVLSSQGYPPDQHVVVLSGIHDPETKLLKLLNVRQVVAEGRVRSVDPGVPYAYLVHHVIEKPAEGILAYMKSDAYGPKDSVVFEKEDIARRPPETLHKESLDAYCTVTAYASDRITLKTRSSSAGYLVLSEVFYPGWTAVVDGRKGEVLCGNYLLRVIPLEKGEHDVTLYFVSWPFRVGGLISLVTLVGSACLLWSLRKRRRDT
jgi:hypothetical protein